MNLYVEQTSPLHYAIQQASQMELELIASSLELMCTHKLTAADLALRKQAEEINRKIKLEISKNKWQ